MTTLPDEIQVATAITSVLGPMQVLIASLKGQIEMLTTDLTNKKAELTRLEATQADLTAAMQPTAPVLTALPVFCTVDMESLRDKILTIDQFNHFIAFSYGIRRDIGQAFQTMSEEQFKAHLRTIPHCDRGTFLTKNQAKTVHTSMTVLTQAVGKLIVVAVAKTQGGGLELRRITGGYRFTNGVTATTGEQRFFHQFPTQTVRKLTPDESDYVASRRTNCYALTWTAELMV
jgi:tetrahydromethanopterin S-methyltransferase subunit B